jgi:hypothetical protein
MPNFYRSILQFKVLKRTPIVSLRLPKSRTMGCGISRSFLWSTLCQVTSYFSIPTRLQRYVEFLYKFDLVNQNKRLLCEKNHLRKVYLFVNDFETKEKKIYQCLTKNYY